MDPLPVRELGPGISDAEIKEKLLEDYEDLDAKEFQTIMQLVRPLVRTAYDLNTGADDEGDEEVEVEGEGEGEGEGGVEEAGGDGILPHTLCDVLASKIGGIGYMSASEGLPICGQCNKPLSLMVQINLSQLPSEAHDHLGLGDEGLIQVWFCNSMEGCDNYDGFSDAELIRYIPGPALSDNTHKDRDTILGLYK
ncbi:protein of unknown function DUF1963, partial [Kipferlia bialata]|eukprot:g8476.t1